MKNKFCHYKPYSVLKQLPVPLYPWDSILMDFIEQLPKSNGYTNILVIIDRLSKQVIFIPTSKMLDSPTLASLSIFHVFAKYSLPSHITSDQDAKFISRFSKFLAQVL